MERCLGGSCDCLPRIGVSSWELGCPKDKGWHEEIQGQSGVHQGGTDGGWRMEDWKNIATLNDD
jgi:hypothetical protein